MSGNKSQLIREMHRREVLAALRLSPHLTRAALAMQLGVTRATAAQLVNDLVAEGLARETGMLSARGQQGGRPGTAVALDGAGGFALGVEIGVDRLRSALLDLEGRVVGQDWVSAEHDARVGNQSPAVICDLIVERSATLLPATQGKGFGVVGVAVPGFTNRLGVVVSAPLIGWSNVPLHGLLSSRLAAPVLVANDANLSAWGEAYFGGVVPPGVQGESGDQSGAKEHSPPVAGFPAPSREAHNLLFVLLEAGVGGGLLSEGMILAGADGLGCEIGHLRLDRWSGPAESDAKIESRLGRGGILKTASAALRMPLDWTRFLYLVASGDPAAHKVAVEESRLLASLLADLTFLFNPDRIVLGGSVSSLFALNLTEIGTMLGRYLVAEFRRPELGVSLFGSACCVLGAAAAAHDMLLNKLAGQTGSPVRLSAKQAMPWESA